MSDRRFRVGCVQMTATADVDANIAQAEELVRLARDQRAQLVGLPEACNFIVASSEEARALAEPEDGNRALAAFQRLADALDCWLLVGSILLRSGPDSLANRSFLIDDRGAIRARYDKIHMFDVDLANGERHRESATYSPGARAIVADVPWARLGMTVCYDLRFAHLYRALALAGAEVLTVPAAFTRFTGQAHWQVLLRARAIENACFVMAPAQCGRNSPKRETFGHAMIVDPWGEVLAEAGEAPGAVTAELDLSAIERARAMVPAIHHDRPFERPPATIDQPALRAAE